MTLGRHMRKAKKTKEVKKVEKDRLIVLRKQGVIEKLEKPTKPSRARSLGYKAKKGFVVVRARIRKGGRTRPLYHRRGRKPSHAGLVKFTPSKSLQWIAEERVQRRYPNMEVMNSYYLTEDGRSKWFEVILVDPRNPSIKSDPNYKWLSQPGAKGRAQRGLTSQGKKGRGLR